LDYLRTRQEFVEAVRNANLEDLGLNEDTLNGLRFPLQHVPHGLNNRFTRLSLELYLSTIHSSRETYNQVCAAVSRCFVPEMRDDTLLSYYSCRKTFERTSGVVEVKHDMCPSGCVAFTGPYSNLRRCPNPRCGLERYLPEQPNDIPAQTFSTFPVGPQIQALRRSPENARAMRHGFFKLAGINDEDMADIDDLFCGDDFLTLLREKGFGEHDTALMFTVDGAQLYRNKKSDIWIGAFVVVNYNPATRYKMRYVLPAFIVPGPKRPKDFDSFMFPTLSHISALQRENNGRGLPVWDALNPNIPRVYSRLFLLLATADTVALTTLDGRVGHHGAHGCRVGCPMEGRHKPGVGIYYPVHLRPDGDEDGPVDFDFRNPIELLEARPERYQADLRTVLESNTQEAYEANRLATGISKPSLLSGLSPNFMLPLPRCCSVDHMHLLCINMCDTFVKHWRGKMACGETDDRNTWEWAVLRTSAAWKTHGALVGASTQFFPSDFHRAPRNIAQYFNSGYKATEKFLYLFGLGPGLLRRVLPPRYYQNFCRLVACVRIVMQRKLSRDDIQTAHTHAVQFVEEYEQLYYQRRSDRIHFCVSAIHTLLHLALETFRTGPGCLTSQFTLERVIGYLGSDLRQPSNPFANYIQIGLLRAQINAFFAVCPEIRHDVPHVPRGSQPLPNNYLLLRPRDRNPVLDLPQHERELLRQRFQTDMIMRWGRISLPDGQLIRSLFCESRKKKRPRRTRNVKVCSHRVKSCSMSADYFIQIQFEGAQRIAEIQYYVCVQYADGQRRTGAMVSLYSEPDRAMLEESLNTLYACRYQGHIPASFFIIPLHDIISLVSMQPLPSDNPGDDPTFWFLIEKSGLDIMAMNLVPHNHDDEDGD